MFGGGKNFVNITSYKEELVFSMYIPLDKTWPIDKTWQSNIITVAGWDNLIIYFNPDQSGITLDKLNLFYSVVAHPDAHIREERLVEATVAMLSPRWPHDSLVLSPKVLHISERNRGTLDLNELLEKKEQVSELIINDGFVLQIRLSNMKK